MCLLLTDQFAFNIISEVCRAIFVLELIAQINSSNGSAASGGDEDDGGAAASGETPSQGSDGGADGGTTRRRSTNHQTQEHTEVQPKYTPEQLEAVKKCVIQWNYSLCSLIVHGCICECVLTRNGTKLQPERIFR